MGHTPWTNVESKKRNLSDIDTKPISTESQTTESVPPTHANTPDFFCYNSLFNPTMAVGDIDNIEFCSNRFFDRETGITQ